MHRKTIIQGYGGGVKWDQRDRNNFKEICCTQEKSLLTLYPWVLYTSSRVEVGMHTHTAALCTNFLKHFFLTVPINDDIRFRSCMIKVISIKNINEINWRIELYRIATLQHFARNTVEIQTNELITCRALFTIKKHTSSINR